MNRYLVGLIILIGVMGRIWVMFSAPTTGDEIYSIWTTTVPLKDILTGAADPVHPPGYYILLRSFAHLSDNLFFLRSLTLILFLVNLFLLFTLGKQTYDSEMGKIWTGLYALSGYFVIFDWQVRMYTASLTLILLSLLLFERKRLVLFTIVNAAGLYCDYVYLWYLLPFIIIAGWLAFFKRSYRPVCLSLMISFGSFFIAYPWFFANLNRGINGITWMKPYISPRYYVPYFLGNFTQQPVFVILHLGLLGILLGLTMPKINRVLQLVLGCVCLSLFGSLLYSYFNKPLFHMRSLQIVALGIMFITGLCWQFIRKSIWWSSYALLAAQVVLFLISIKTILNSPDIVLVEYMNWKQILNDVHADNYVSIDYKVNDVKKALLQPFGLEYSLARKDSWHAQPLKFTRIGDTSRTNACVPLTKSVIEIYGCNE